MIRLTHIILWTVLLLSTLSEAVGPFTMSAIATGIGATLYKFGLDPVYCYYNECSDDYWIPNNVTAVESLLEDHLFGQHIARRVIIRALRAHLRKKSPSKALTLSFHGWTGTGKNYVSRFVAEGLYKKGTQSQFVHTFIATSDFPFSSKVEEYSAQLQSWIRGNVSVAPQSLFVFDEIDKMPLGLIDAIKPFIDHHDHIRGVDFRRSIFMFLSNTGGGDINRQTLEFWEKGKTREALQYTDFEELINLGAFNEKGGLQHSMLLEKALIDHFVPFLPLERSHIAKCIKIAAKNRALLEEDVEKIVNQLDYWPEGVRLYSRTGCKKVEKKVELVLESYLDDL